METLQIWDRPALGIIDRQIKSDVLIMNKMQIQRQRQQQPQKSLTTTKSPTTASSSRQQTTYNLNTNQIMQIFQQRNKNSLVEGKKSVDLLFENNGTEKTKYNLVSFVEFLINAMYYCRKKRLLVKSPNNQPSVSRVHKLDKMEM
ncbi:conserved hypothetical protein [Trichinella spiralis]|uniref:hypothetical protein n=1 Tax=Trichinella spiralis TaxID=6334 RepID=UPI0001EFE7BE|nr:conserved hypothetical protein [Trichinella spiralis]XP_003370334.1 conserved hypothetical protein [Trichinella spiralis]